MSTIINDVKIDLINIKETFKISYNKDIDDEFIISTVKDKLPICLMNIDAFKIARSMQIHSIPVMDLGMATAMVINIHFKEGVYYADLSFLKDFYVDMFSKYVKTVSLTGYCFVDDKCTTKFTPIAFLFDPINTINKGRR